jgi:hypothetical protein
MNIVFSHITRFPVRRVYRVDNTDITGQLDALRFIETHGGFQITNTRNKIKFIIL